MSGRIEAARAAAETLAAIRAHETPDLRTLAPHMSDVAPDAAVELLVACALEDDAPSIHLLFGLFGRFEMPAVALARALGLGKERAARALLARGVSLDAGFLPVDVAGDSDTWRGRRYIRYLDRMLPEGVHDIPGKAARPIGGGVSEPGLVWRVAVSSENAPLLVALARERAFPQTDLDGLLFAALIDEEYGLARALAAHGARPDAAVLFVAAYGPGSKPRTITALPDLFFPTAPPELARVLADIAPWRVQELWTPGLAITNPETARILVPHLGPARTRDARALTARLARLGYASELSHVLGWDLPDKRAIVARALEEALDARQTETELLCMNALSALASKDDPDDLEL